jgi:hypothetical protein
MLLRRRSRLSGIASEGRVSRMTDYERVLVVKELAGAASAQSQVANRYWIALITVALVAVLPRPEQGAGMWLPFGLGPIEPGLFYPAMFGLVVVLMIAFASAHAQQVRVQRLSHLAMDRLGNESVLGVRVHPRDFFDALRLPSVIRLAPLAQLFKGRDVFFGSPVAISAGRRWASALYYLLLKAVSWLVYFGFPAGALWFTYARVEGPDWLSAALVVPATIASGALGHVLFEDIRYVREVTEIVMQPNAPSNTGGQSAAADEIASRRS